MPGCPGLLRLFVLESVNWPFFCMFAPGELPVAVEPVAETAPLEGVLASAALPVGLAAGELPVAVEPWAETMPPR